MLTGFQDNFGSRVKSNCGAACLQSQVIGFQTGTRNSWEWTLPCRVFTGYKRGNVLRPELERTDGDCNQRHGCCHCNGETIESSLRRPLQLLADQRLVMQPEIRVLMRKIQKQCSEITIVHEHGFKFDELFV